ncbi:integral membrane protein dgcr2 idd [Pitangus sulphuratus]|nr:integral membrane protein dgcr2 idd [Pitangus sulphuratus]
MLSTGDDHCPGPACHTIPDTGQDATGLLGHLGTLLAHVQLLSISTPRFSAAGQLSSHSVALHWVVVTHVFHLLELGLVEPHTIGLRPSIQPVQIPLQTLPALQQTNTPTRLGVIWKLTEGTLDPLVLIIDKDIKQT